MSDVLHTFHGRFEGLAERDGAARDRHSQYAWLTNNTRRMALNSDSIRAFDLTPTWAEGEGPCMAIHPVQVLTGDASGVLKSGRDARMIIPLAVAKKLAW